MRFFLVGKWLLDFWNNCSHLILFWTYLFLGSELFPYWLLTHPVTHCSLAFLFLVHCSGNHDMPLPVSGSMPSCILFCTLLRVCSAVEPARFLENLITLYGTMGNDQVVMGCDLLWQTPGNTVQGLFWPESPPDLLTIRYSRKVVISSVV